MEHKFALFVALASIKACEELQALVLKHKVAVTDEIVDDAARAGQKRALEMMFPGLVRIPFTQAPIEDIKMAIKYQFGLVTQGGSTLAPTPLATKEESSRHKMPASASRYKIAGQAKVEASRLSNGEVLKPTPLAVSDETARRGMPPRADETSRRLSTDVGIALPPPVADESSHNGVYATAAGAPAPTEETQPRTTGTNLRKIGGAPIFPWEKKKG